MGIDIHGWVEYCDKGLDDWDGEVFWYGLADVDGLIERQHYAFALLFGTGIRNSFTEQPIAPHRGLPSDVSWRTKEDAEEEPIFHSHTWITWQEILAADREEPKIERLPLREMLRSTGFDFVFEIMEITAKRYGDEYVRLVVWFDGH